MFVLRIFLRTGLSFDFQFGDLPTATAALDAVTKNRQEPCPVEVMDDAGRQTRFDGKEILAEMLIDAEVECVTMLRWKVMIDRVSQNEMQRLGMAASQFDQPVTRQRPTPAPMDDDAFEAEMDRRREQVSVRSKLGQFSA